MGLKQEKILEYIPNLKAPVGRMEIIKYKTNSIIIDYAHTPDAIEKVMSAISGLVEGNIYVVFGCTGDRDRLKRPIMTEYVANHSSYFIITNDDPHYEEPTQIVDDMTKDLEKDNYEVCLDREEAIVKGINLLKDKDVLFILGKGHEEAIIIRDKRIPFNDHQVVVDYLEKLNGGEN
jgi:UDP-N-acetylmuramoyl-L-alanyl-D-glutamate--2,6-diaminopimelate ligase